MHLSKDYLLERYNMLFPQIDSLLEIKNIRGLDAEQMNSVRLYYMESNIDLSMFER